MPRQSGRFGVISSTSTSVEIWMTSCSGVPGLTPSSSTMIPSWSSLIWSSRSERIMPCDATPRSLASPSSLPSGITAPGRATPTVWPAATFGAPQTICAGLEPPTSTMQTFRRSASGCFLRSSTRPTTKFSSAVTPWCSTRSTSVPVSARRCASVWTSMCGSQYSCSHSRGTLMRTAPGSGRRCHRTGADR